MQVDSFEHIVPNKYKVISLVSIAIGGILLLVSLLLGFQNWQLHTSLAKKRANIPSTPEPRFIKQVTPINEQRIGTDPFIEVIPRFYALFKAEGLDLDPYCLYSCGMSYYQNGRAFQLENAASLGINVADDAKAEAVFSRVIDIFSKNQYTISPDFEETDDKGYEWKTATITHSQQPIVCGVTREVYNEQTGYGKYHGFSPSVMIRCALKTAENQQFVDLQNSMAADLLLKENEQLRVGRHTESYALISVNGEKCSLVQKTNQKWVMVESGSCQDPPWYAYEGPPGTFIRVYGIPQEDAEYLSQ